MSILYEPVNISLNSTFSTPYIPNNDNMLATNAANSAMFMPKSINDIMFTSL